ncbi:hypothetical protein [Nesterenkonia marinintestina]|uniref:hypothetical protein n=1 Tax=Nesterenkonia marinintestina TaxID=2979865 RepID=UPI0021C1669F|nr:hypothetical protein [Nesterenkonia sp. GX14115]
MFSHITTPATVVADGIQESDLPSADFDAPWMEAFTGVGGWLIATAIVLLVIAIGLGVVWWVFGKFSKTGGAQEAGLSIVAISFVAAFIIGIAATAIIYMTEIGPEWMTFDSESVGEASVQIEDQPAEQPEGVDRLS